MPNWQLSYEIKSYIKHRAGHLSLHMLRYAQADFPVTVDQLQYAVMDAEKVNTLRRYIKEGVQTIAQYHEIRVAFLRENFPELRRSAVVELTLPDWIVVDRVTQYGIHTTKFDMNERHYLVPDLNPHLSPEQRADLITWINRVIRQKRLHEIVNYTVAEILDKHAKSAAHLHAVWPMLCTLLQNDGSNTTRHLAPWKERFRAPVRPMRMYQPTPDVIKTFGKLIAAADTVLIGASLLPEYERDNKTIIAELEHWECAEGDRTF